MLGHIEMYNPPPIVPQDDKAVKESESGGRNNEKVRRRDLTGMIFEEGLPVLRRRLPAFDSILGHGRFRHVKTEQPEFSLKTGTPHRGLSRDIRRISSRISAAIFVRPTRRVFDFHFQ